MDADLEQKYVEWLNFTSRYKLIFSVLTTIKMIVTQISCVCF